MPLYKYARPDRLDVLQRREVRFTQPGALNDPFELRPRFETLISEAEALGYLSETPIDLEPMLRQAYALLSEEQRSTMSYESAAALIGSLMATNEARANMSATFLALLQSMKDLAPLLRDQVYQVLNSNVGILSLSEAPDDSLMWAHYADSHRGMVLGFNQKHPFFNHRRSPNDEFYFLRRVLYSDTAPASSLLTFEGDTVFITKGTQWAYEREWRMLAPLNDATRNVQVQGDVVYLFGFPSEALGSVILGAHAEAALETAITDLVRNDPELGHVRVSRAVFDLDSQRVRVR